MRFPAAVAVAWGLALTALPGTSDALRVVKDSFQVSPPVAELTRTITVSVILEDDVGQGGDVSETMTPEPGRLVRRISEKPHAFSCDKIGVARSKGEWVYEAIAPGTVTFRLNSTLVSCTLNEASPVEAVSAPVVLKPPQIWSGIQLEPKIMSPGGRVRLVLSLRNDGADTIFYGVPWAQAELQGAERAPVIPVGPVQIEPGPAVAAGSLTLKAGETVRATWLFEAIEPGETRFLITGAGLIMMSPFIRVRHAPVLEASLAVPGEDGAVGAVTALKAELRSRGAPGIAAPDLRLFWRPEESATLVETSFQPVTVLTPDSEPLPASFRVELLKPGPVEFTLSAWGREADTGARVEASPSTAKVRVLPPPELKLSLSLSAATVLVGAELSFTLEAYNSGVAGASAVSPVFHVEKGEARFGAVRPMFQALPAGARGRFAGALTASSPGTIEFDARISTRGQEGGILVDSVSPRARLLALPEPRFELSTRPARVFGGRGRQSLFLRNSGEGSVRIETARVRVSGGDYDATVGVLPAGPLLLDAGETATLYCEADPAGSKAPYWLEGTLALEGRIRPYGVRFARSFSPRPLALVCPLARDFVILEPESGFRPPLDPVLSVEWTLTASGRAGLAVLNGAGGLVRVLAAPKELPPGAHRALWDGRDSAGKPVPAGDYRITLAGKCEDGAKWPEGAEWQLDRAIRVGGR